MKNMILISPKLLTNIVICSSHTVPKQGSKNLNGRLKKIFNAMWKLLEYLQARREVYEIVVEYNTYPLSYSIHRLCESQSYEQAANLIPRSFNFTRKLNNIAKKWFRCKMENTIHIDLPTQMEIRKHKMLSFLKSSTTSKFFKEVNTFCLQMLLISLKNHWWNTFIWDVHIV